MNDDINRIESDRRVPCSLVAAVDDLDEFLGRYTRETASQTGRQLVPAFHVMSNGDSEQWQRAMSTLNKLDPALARHRVRRYHSAASDILRNILILYLNTPKVDNSSTSVSRMFTSSPICRNCPVPIARTIAYPIVQQHQHRANSA